MKSIKGSKVTFWTNCAFLLNNLTLCWCRLRWHLYKCNRSLVLLAQWIFLFSFLGNSWYSLSISGFSSYLLLLNSNCNAGFSWYLLFWYSILFSGFFLYPAFWYFILFFGFFWYLAFWYFNLFSRFSWYLHFYIPDAPQDFPENLLFK